MIDAGLIASLIVIPAVAGLRAAFAIHKRFVPLITLIIGPLVMGGGHALHFPKTGDTWQMAMMGGWVAALLASGLYSNAKTLTRKD